MKLYWHRHWAGEWYATPLRRPEEKWDLPPVVRVTCKRGPGIAPGWHLALTRGTDEIGPFRTLAEAKAEAERLA